jgi:hypothetical protein
VSKPKRTSWAVAGIIPAAALIRFGMPTLASLIFLAVIFFLAVLVLGVACWIINSGDRCDRVNRMMLASRGDPRCLKTSASTLSPPIPRPRRQSIRSERDATGASTRKPPGDSTAAE